ncbi:OPT superfamily oligopeptide transporter [Sphaerulina musiva SO2202]|uniref:OPT superfamily oligopeptide transporter n=1 Tax=Sphaerulina musiva (strain SO2202) TaxID=692275 RepID=M3D3D5_SPHMS|nr:OPT superfamily oligopeptide transporter [Sphaerulina musiva SO2202]EMF12399.1 OPT superfamily oligopeptide transporter [Sphaerulina musiva SO2202]
MTVDLEDGREPILTFRFWVLTTIWSIIGSTVQTVFFFKPFGGSLDESAVQLLSWGCGIAMAKYLPTHVFNTFGYRWTMNPAGPFRIKEHAMVTCAYSQATSVSYALGALTCLELWYGRRINAFWGIMYLSTSMFIGYGIAGLLREHLVTPPTMYYPMSLPKVALFRAMHSSSATTKKGVKFFAIALTATFVWTWFPQYIIPVLASLPIICWFGHGNPKAFVLGSGTYGFGFFTLSLDYNYINGFLKPLVSPLWVSVTQGVAIIFACWILYPILYYTNTFNAQKFGAMTTSVYTAAGKPYNASAILTPEFQLNQTALAERGAPHWAPSYIFRFFWGLTSISATIAFALCYYGSSAWQIAVASLSGRYIEYNDPYLQVMSRYPKVPRYWYAVVLVLSVSMSLLTFYQGGFQLPWWGFAVFFILALVLTYPNGILTAIAGTSPGDTMISDLIAGFIFHGKPLAVMSCFAFANPILGQALSLLSMFKLGYYLKIPERPMFWGQMWGTAIVPLVNYGVTRLVLDNIDHAMLKGIKHSVSWNALGTKAWYSASILWGVIGPGRMFGSGSEYNFVYYGALIGFLVVVLTYYLQRWMPNLETEYYLNAPIFFQSFSEIPIAPMTSFFSGFIASLVFMGYILRRHPVWWANYNYLLAMALACGVAFQGLVMAFAFNMPRVDFPNWWGNHPDYPDRCFPPTDKLPAAMQV